MSDRVSTGRSIRLKYLLPLIGYFLPTAVITYGIVIPAELRA